MRPTLPCHLRIHAHDVAELLQLVDWTDGCIAVTDSDMDEIWAMVADGTPIEIER
ncbi:L,D-transpeptidase family protein [Mesorhizobium sp. M1396]|uniref:L,D-transpeptidase family protein n=1 Tax=unclassified Mesorhizobium TaxID=325217 RepID=UPI0033350D6B